MKIIVTYVQTGLVTVGVEEHWDALTATVGEAGELNIIDSNGDTIRTYAPGVWRTIDYRYTP